MKTFKIPVFVVICAFCMSTSAFAEGLNVYSSADYTKERQIEPATAPEWSKTAVPGENRAGPASAKTAAKQPRAKQAVPPKITNTLQFKR